MSKIARDLDKIAQYLYIKEIVVSKEAFRSLLAYLNLMQRVVEKNEDLVPSGVYEGQLYYRDIKIVEYK